MDPNILHNISYGMYIVASNKGELLNGQVVNTVFQVTSEPIIIGVSINKKNLTCEFIEASQHFSISILPEETPLSFIGKFGFKSGRTVDKFKDTKFKLLASGCPVISENTLGYIEVDLTNKLDYGTHMLFLGRARELQIIKSGKPMTYEYYHIVKKGTTPETAPTFLKSEIPQQKTVISQKYRCVVCNYIYDPAAGDIDSGIAPGTAFEDMPDNWICPMCGADKSQFTTVNVCE